MTRICSIIGCNRKHEARGFCRTHYRRWKTHGDPHTLLIHKAARGAPMAWISQHVSFERNDVCLPWPFNRDRSSGQAQISVNRTSTNPARIMCEAVNGPAPSERHQAAHSCGNAHTGCMNPHHLRWATQTENEADKRLHGTIAVGERHGRSKLTTKQVIQIRQMGGPLMRAAVKFGVSERMISRIRRRENWKHI